MKTAWSRTEVATSTRRVRLLAGQVAGQALRMRLIVLLGMVAAMLVLGARWLRAFNFGAPELKFIADFGLAAIGLTGALFAALGTAHLFFSDLPGAAACVLTRCVRRWEYLAGHLGAMAALLAVFMMLLGILLAGLLGWRAHELGVAVPAMNTLLGTCALQWMKCTLIAAMTLLVCTYAGTALFASGAGLLLALIAQLRPFAPESGLGWLRIWPNLALFDAENWLASGGAAAGMQLGELAGYWAGYLALFFGLAAYAFKHREF